MSSKNSGKGKQWGKRRRTQDSAAPSSAPCEEAGQSGEASDPLHGERVFDEWARPLTAREWERQCSELSEKMTKGEDTLQLWAAGAEGFCKRCEVNAEGVWSLGYTLLTRSREALREYSRRYLRALRDLNAEREERNADVEKSLAIGEEFERRQLKLDERIREVVMERDQLRESLASTEEQLQAALAAGEGSEREGRASPSRDAEVEEMREVEMGGRHPPPSAPLGEAVIPAILEALEGWFEAKWDRMVSHGAPTNAEGGKEQQTTANRSDSWAKAVGRRAGGRPCSIEGESPHPGGRGGGAARTSSAARRGAKNGPEPKPPSFKRSKGRKWPAVPGTAVVAVNPPPGGTQAGVDGLMREAQQVLSLEELGVPPLEIKRSKMGGYLLAVKGPGSKEGADRLAKGLRELPGAAGVAVSRPVKRLEVRLTGLGPGVTPEEAVRAVAAAGGCSTDEIRPGAIGSSPTGMGSLWMRCPAAAAIRVAKAGGVGTGWSWTPVELLQTRPERCFRCLEFGHLRAQCASPVDRSARCYRCGEVGHAARCCKEAVPCCPLCGEDGGGNGRHVLGGPGCPQTPPRRKPAAKTAANVTPSGVT